jgi:shikimate dehydrogenase
MKFALIGDPVAHSISPALHEGVFERLGIDAQYEKIHVLRGELGVFVGGQKTGQGAGAAEVLDGFNVTIPHKVAILPYLDEIRGDAQVAGTVNTVVREDGRLIGYNTDMEGLLQALKCAGSGYKDKVVCVFGAGGAAQGAVVKAAMEGAKTVRAIARNQEKAGEICALAAEAAAVAAADAVEIQRVEPENGGIPPGAVADADVFINATPLGMQGYAQDFSDFGFLDALPKTAIVYDCVYIPAETTILREARARGLKAENGLSMLVWQGFLSDAYFLRAVGETRFTKAEIFSQEMFAAVYQTLESVLNKH